MENIFRDKYSHCSLQAGASAMPSGAAANAEVVSNNAVGGASGGQGATGGTDTRPKIKNKNQTFGGFQKGFLFNATASSGKHDKRTNETRNLTESNAAGAKKTYNKDMPFIKPKQTNREKGLEIPEVQQAMLASEGLLQNKGTLLLLHVCASVCNSVCEMQKWRKTNTVTDGIVMDFCQP